jgi:hypothetical protein
MKLPDSRGIDLSHILNAMLFGFEGLNWYQL